MKKLLMVTVMFLATFVATNAYGQISNTILANIGGKTNGAAISKSALVAAGKIALNTSAKKVVSFRMVYKKNNQNKELISSSENLTPEMITAINSLTSGSAVNFVKITCKNAKDKADKTTPEFTAMDFMLKIQ